MPILLKNEIAPAGEIGVWEVSEPISYFEKRVNLYPAEKIETKILSHRKRLEWFASRYLLHLMSGRLVRMACVKDSYGKPHLEDSSYQISMSHSNDRVAIIASPHIVGIDIQKIVGKIERIQNKFLNEKEAKSLDPLHKLAQLHVYWGAKESLYKAYGRKGLNFKEHILIDPFVYNSNGMHLSGEVVFGDYHKSFDIFASELDDYILVYAINRP